MLIIINQGKAIWADQGADREIAENRRQAQAQNKHDNRYCSGKDDEHVVQVTVVHCVYIACAGSERQGSRRQYNPATA